MSNRPGILQRMMDRDRDVWEALKIAAARAVVRATEPEKLERRVRLLRSLAKMEVNAIAIAAAAATGHPAEAAVIADIADDIWADVLEVLVERWMERARNQALLNDGDPSTNPEAASV